MTASTPAGAVELYRQSLQRTLSCVTDGVLSAIGGPNASPYEPPGPHMLLLQSGQGVPLLSDDDFALRVAFRYEITESRQNRRQWSVRTREYTYSIEHAGPDRSTELMTWHWQPTAARGQRWPHFHIGLGIAGAALRYGGRHIHRIHVPTGPVTLDAIVRLAIEELRVQPRRSDWQSVLAENQIQ